jgi:hypothetical protein
MHTNHFCDIEVIICGENQLGEKFRPSDWAERLADLASVFHNDKRLHYSHFIQPITSIHGPALMIKHSTNDNDVIVTNFILNFAKCNNLKIITEHFENFLI